VSLFSYLNLRNLLYLIKNFYFKGENNMKTSKLLTACMALCLLLALSACSGTAKSAAKDYVDKTSNEEMQALFVKATYIEQGFADPADISANDLFRFAILADEDGGEEWYDQTDSRYEIPVSELRQVLDTYLDGYSFDPTQLTLYAQYDESEDMLVAAALGFGTGSSDPVFSKAEATEDDVVTVTLKNGDTGTITVTATITDDGVKFQSCT
jgi:hypothetical protein